MDLTASLNQFAFNLYEKMSNGKDENFFISPFSISSALAMVFAGARTETAEQLKALLNVGELDGEHILSMYGELVASLEQLNGAVSLNTANKVYAHDGFALRSEFNETLSKHFRSGTEQVNYANADAAAKLINDWVALQTREKITDLIDPSILNELTRLVLVNAIYFKGSWLNKFRPELTEKDDFFLRDGSSTKVDMMKLFNKKFRLQINPAGLKAMTCEFPYVGKSVSMTIILPHEGINLEDVEKDINAQALHEVLHENVEAGKVHAHIPKFKLAFESELSEFLKELGATLAFDEARADFRGISDAPEGLYVSKVVHKAVVEVNEEGTEAAAATAAVMNARCMTFEAPPEEFKCNRPFIFVIHDNQNKNILFLGKYAKPE